MFGNKDKLSTETVMKALEGVTDPILEKNLIAAGMVKEAKVDGGKVRVSVELPTPAWEPKALLEQEIRRVLGGIVGDRTVEIAWGSNVRVSRPVSEGQPNLVPGARNIILFASGKGGVGKSTIASNVACALAKMGANVGLLDADIYGPSVPTMFGTSETPSVAAGGNKLQPVIQHGLKLMSIGFVVDSKEAMSWRGPMLNGALIQFMRDVEWGDLDYLCLDLPPGTGDVQLTIAQNVKVSGAVLVSTPQDVALADVTRAKAMFDRVDIPLLGVVENMSYFECGNCSTVHHIFDHGGASKLAEEIGVPTLGEVPIESNAREAGDAGTPVVLTDADSGVSKAITTIAQRLATDLARQAAASDGGKKTRGSLRIVQ